MKKIGANVRNGVKIIVSGSIQACLGGVVAAVVPPTVSIPYKVVTYIGSMMAAAYVADKMDGFVDEKCNEVAELVDMVRDCQNKLKEEKA